MQPLDVQHYTFLGLPYRVEEADVVIVPVQSDKAASSKAGTADGPREIIHASWKVRGYDEELGVDITDYVKIATHVALAPSIYPYENICRVERLTLDLLNHGKFVFGLGGDHSLSAGFVRAHKRFQIKPFAVLHFDAHADFRPIFEGSIWSHACVMRRIGEWGIPIVSVGVRNISQDVAEYLKKVDNPRIFWARSSSLDWRRPLEDLASEISEAIPSERVYVTFDVDCLDLSEIGGCTGTPEPRGLRRDQVEAIFKKVAQNKTIIGGDVMEFRPCGEATFAYAVSIARLIYQFLTYTFHFQKR